MTARNRNLLSELDKIASQPGTRLARFRAAALFLRNSGPYRWVGLYEVDRDEAVVRNLVWSGPTAPAFTVFSIGSGLTGSAIAQKKTINVGEVLQDPRYLTALGSTESEIIVPVFDLAGREVVGTIDIESERRKAFNNEIQAFLESCAEVMKPLWNGHLLHRDRPKSQV